MMKYIYFKGGKYRIRKTIKGKVKDFGSYKSRRVAQYMVEFLMEHDWEVPPYHIFMLEEMYHVVADMTEYSSSKAGVQYVGCASSLVEAEKLASNPLGEKYLNKIHEGYNITKTINKQVVSFGYFKDHMVAYAMREYLLLCEWQLPTHNDTYVIHIKGRYYKIRIENKKIKLIDHSETPQFEADDDMQNIYKTRHGYSISRLVGKHRENYKTYKTLPEAQSMRDFLRKNNWNTELFHKEYNKRYPTLPEHIYKHNGRYVVRRFWKGMTKNYGTYNTLQEAEQRVQYLEKNSWQDTKQISIVNYGGVFYIMKNINHGFATPFRRFYYGSENRDDAEKMLEQYKTEGFPEPFITTNKYRYIIRNRNVYYVMYHRRKLCYTRLLCDAFVARDLCELFGMVPLVPGEYVVGDVVYNVVLNSWGTPIFSRG